MKKKASSFQSFRLATFLGVFLTLWLLPSLLNAVNPGWWTDREVINVNSADDYAPANIGQLKQIASKASLELDENLPGGGSAVVQFDAVSDLIGNWEAAAESGVTRDDYSVLTTGQLKNVARLFYDCLKAVGYTDNYPWTETLTDDDDYAIANIGQLKHIFAFDLTTDVDGGTGDGLPDWWEQQIIDADSGDAIDDLSDVLTTDDFDGDGLTNLSEYQHGTDPNSTDSDGDYLPDSWEVFYGLNPARQDADGDSIWDTGEDPDDDGLVNYWEWFLGRDPTDAHTDASVLDDSHKDIDGDGMTDGEEILFEFDLFQPQNAFEDADGDGYPNLVEIRRGKPPRDAEDFPAPDITVSAPTISDPHPVQDAIDALALDDLDYGIIKLISGYYPENIEITARPVVLIGDGSHPGASLDGQLTGSVVESNKDCAFIGLRFVNGDAALGGGIYVTSARIRLTNCILMNNTAEHGGAIALESAQAWLQNCTLYQNVGSSDGPGIDLSGTSAELWADASIIWNTPDPLDLGLQITAVDPLLVHVSRCNVLDEYDGVDNFEVEPILNVYGRIIVYSTCIDAFASNSQTPAFDIDNEPRSDGFPDVGADEYVDANSDFLPDAWVSAYTSLGAWDADPDGDGRLNFDEYQYGSMADYYDALPPSRLEGLAVAPTQINLSWFLPGQTSLISYLLERKTGSSSYSQIAEVVDPAQYIDQSVLADTAYTYRLRTQFETRVSEYSNEINVTTPATESLIPLDGLKLWLRADSLTQDSGKHVAVWPDQSGNSFHAFQETTTRQPVLALSELGGFPVVRFDGENYWSPNGQFIKLPDVMGGANAGEIFFTVKAFAGTVENGAGLMVFGQSNYSAYPSFTGDNLAEGFGSTRSRSIPQHSEPLDDFHVYNCVSTKGFWDAKYNGIPYYHDYDNSVYFRTNPTIGTGNELNLWGDVAEVILYDRKLTPEERLKVGQYLSSKYSLASPPAAPTSLTAANFSHAAIALTWTESSNNVVIYSIERRVGTDDFSQIGTTELTSFVDRTAIFGIQYQYRVSAINIGGVSDYSDEVDGRDAGDLDSDGDGLTDDEESVLGSDPNDSDENLDGILDGAGFLLGYSPLDTDVDDDGILNEIEIANGTNPFDSDTDHDGVDDSTDDYPFDPLYFAFDIDTTPTAGPVVTLLSPLGATLSP